MALNIPANLTVRYCIKNKGTSLPAWGDDLDGICGIHDQPSGQQTDGEAQQMRWSQRGAHLLLQVRTRTLDGILCNDFVRWYPRMAMTDGTRADPHQKAA